MTVLITGGAGFVGNNIIKQLVERKIPVRAMVRSPQKAGKRLGHYGSQVEIVPGDITKPDTLTGLFEGVTAVIHTIAISMEKGGQTYESVNYQGTVHLVNAAKEAGVMRFINMSQNGADSTLPYRFLASKGKAQEYVAQSGLQWTAIRPSAIFGTQDEFFNTFARLVKLTPVVFPLIGGGTAQFQPVSVLDVAEATVRCLEDESTIGKNLVLGGPEVLSLGEIENRVIAALGTRRMMIPAPVWLLRPAVVVMEKILPGSPVSTSLLDLLAVPNIVEDNALINHFGMDPIPFSGENIVYLRDASAVQAIRKFATNAVIN